MRTTLTAKCQLTLPAEIRKRLGLGPGDQIDFCLNADGVIEARPVRATTGSVLDLAGCLGPPPNGPQSLEDMERAIARGAAGLLDEDEAVDDDGPA